MFTLEDRKQLECFCDVCDKIAICRFIVNFSKQPHHIFVGKLPDGRVMDQYPRYDDDDFRAFLTHYRKLRLDQEPTHIFRVMNLLKRKGDASDRELFEYFKKEIKEEGQSWWFAVLHDENGNKEFLTQERLEDLILNGEVFHSDSDKKDALKRVIGNSSLPKALAFFNYLRFARTVIHCASKTAALIREKGYLVCNLSTETGA